MSHFETHCINSLRCEICTDRKPHPHVNDCPKSNHFTLNSTFLATLYGLTMTIHITHQSIFFSPEIFRINRIWNPIVWSFVKQPRCAGFGTQCLQNRSETVKFDLSWPFLVFFWSKISETNRQVV